MNESKEEKTKALVLDAFDVLFNKKDFAKAAEYWSEWYIQHSALVPAGKGRSIRRNSQPSEFAL
jgi:predicted SnoaL-like aldol condensation-catalyzing enzyme